MCAARYCLDRGAQVYRPLLSNVSFGDLPHLEELDGGCSIQTPVRCFASEEHALDKIREIYMETKKLAGVDPEVMLDDPESNLVA